ncbi:MAG TPA: hypothetical protein VGF77_17565 [Allosphingosinicella sp.]|jgi:hypothetical protein
MAQFQASAGHRNKMAGILIVAGSLIIAAAAVAELVYRGTAAPHQGHYNLADVGRAIIPGMGIFLFGCVFLIDRPGIEDFAPETLPWLQRPRVRRRFAIAYFALGAVIVFISVYRGP